MEGDHIVFCQAIQVGYGVNSNKNDGGVEEDVDPAGPGELVHLGLGGDAVLFFAFFLQFFLIGFVSGVIQEDQGEGEAHVDGGLQHQGELLDQRQVHLERKENDGKKNDTVFASFLAHTYIVPFL